MTTVALADRRIEQRELAAGVRSLSTIASQSAAGVVREAAGVARDQYDELMAWIQAPASGPLSPRCSHAPGLALATRPTLTRCATSGSSPWLGTRSRASLPRPPWNRVPWRWAASMTHSRRWASGRMMRRPPSHSANDTAADGPHRGGSPTRPERGRFHTWGDLRSARNASLKAHHPDKAGSDSAAVRRATYWTPRINEAMRSSSRSRCDPRPPASTRHRDSPSPQPRTCGRSGAGRFPEARYRRVAVGRGKRLGYHPAVPGPQGAAGHETTPPNAPDGTTTPPTPPGSIPPRDDLTRRATSSTPPRAAQLGASVPPTRNVAVLRGERPDPPDWGPLGAVSAHRWHAGSRSHPHTRSAGNAELKAEPRLRHRHHRNRGGQLLRLALRSGSEPSPAVLRRWHRLRTREVNRHRRWHGCEARNRDRIQSSRCSRMRVVRSSRR